MISKKTIEVLVTVYLAKRPSILFVHDPAFFVYPIDRMADAIANKLLEKARKRNVPDESVTAAKDAKDPKDGKQKPSMTQSWKSFIASWYRQLIYTLSNIINDIDICMYIYIYPGYISYIYTIVIIVFSPHPYSAFQPKDISSVHTAQVWAEQEPQCQRRTLINLMDGRIGWKFEFQDWILYLTCFFLGRW